MTTKRRADKQTKSGTAEQPAKEKQPETTPKERPPRPHDARRYARRKFAEQLPDILKTYSTAAVSGDIASLKALIALVGFDREDAHVPPARRRRGKSLAQLFLEDMKKSTGHQATAIVESGREHEG